MKKKIDTITIIAFFVGLIPFGIYFKLYPQMPQIVAMHYNVAGLADGFAGKSSPKVLAMCGIGILGLLFMKLVSFFVIKFSQSSYEHDINDLKSQMNIATFLVTILFVGMSSFFLITTNKAYKISLLDNLRAINIIIGLITVIVGNYFPKFKQNNFLGFRTKATLLDETVWFKTQRFAGKVWIIGGITIIICSLLLGSIAITVSSFIAPISYILLAAIPMIYANNLSKSC